MHQNKRHGQASKTKRQKREVPRDTVVVQQHQRKVAGNARVKATLGVVETRTLLACATVFRGN